MSEEVHELHEHAEEAHHDRALAPVTVTMAVLAVLVATVSLLGHRTHTEELLLQSRSTDRWAQYQAKSIRRHNYDMFGDLLAVAAVRDAGSAAKLGEKYKHEVDRYREDQKELDAEARKLEAETEHVRHQADRFDLGEVFLEVALVITSMTLLTRRRAFWIAALVIAAGGLVIAVSGFLVH